MLNALKKLTLAVAATGMLAISPMTIDIGNTAKADFRDGWRARGDGWRGGRWRNDSYRRWRGNRVYRPYYYTPYYYEPYYARRYYGTPDWYVPYYDFYRIPGVGRW